VYEVDLATGMMKNTVRLGSRRGGHGGVTGHVALGPEGAAVASAHRVHVFLDLEGLERQLERASRRSPDDPDVHLRLAEIRWRKDQRRAALADLEKALRLAKRLGRAGQADRRRAERALYRLWRELAQRPELQISGVPVSVEDRYDRALAFADSDAERVGVLVELLIAAAGTGREKTFIGTARRLIDDFPQQGVSIDRRLLEIVQDFLEERANVSAGLVAAVAAATRLEAKKRYAEAVGYYQEVIRRFPDGLVGDENAWDYAGDRIRRLEDRRLVLELTLLRMAHAGTLPQLGEQLSSLVALQFDGQQPSPSTQAMIGEFVQATLQLPALPVIESAVQALPSSQDAGQSPSQVSPGSIVPLKAVKPAVFTTGLSTGPP